MFKWLKNTSKKVDDTLDQTKKDLGETSVKIQNILDESSDSVKTVVKVLVIALGISMVTNCITMFTTLSKHKCGKSKIPTITIQNLYLGDRKL